MYLVSIHVPIYVDGSTCLVTTDWKRSLELLRDSLQDRFSELHVIAPTLESRRARCDQQFESVCSQKDGIVLHPSIPASCRARAYWTSLRPVWIRDNRKLLRDATIVHSTLDDVYKPLAFDAWRCAVKMRVPTVFVQDMDVSAKHWELESRKSLRRRIAAWNYCLAYEKMCAYAVSRSSLCLLKGESLAAKYGKFSSNVIPFHDTSHSREDVVDTTSLERRLDSLKPGRPLRFVYCGRLVDRKGIQDSIRTIHETRDKGGNVTLDLIGNGPLREQLEAYIRENSLRGAVRLLGSREYGRDLLSDLAKYDGLLFTPKAEDTPRMIFDGFAAGLPLVASDINYVRERDAEDRCVVLLPQANTDGAAETLAELSAQPNQLRPISRRAREAGLRHASENWYRVRARATLSLI